MDQSNPPLFFGEWLKQRRKALDLTQEELAQKAGCSIFALRKIESGERRPSKQLAGLLADSLGIPPDEKQTFIRVARGDLNLERLASPSSDRREAAASGYQRPVSPGNIPVQPTPLVGRESELALMQKIFLDPQCRLMTLTGVGGIGKTRLAIEFSSRQMSAFPAGVFYVPLAPIHAAESMIPAIADAFGIGFAGPIDPKEQLLNYIRNSLNQPLVLVLDNLEHLLHQASGSENTSAIELVSELLQQLPHVKILATSRERLNLRGEWTYELHGLPVPPDIYTGGLERYSAIELFMQSAQRVMPDFELTTEQQPHVVRTCQLLDGIPLAIELAAAWVDILSCQEIAQEINSNIDFLSTSMHDIPERHRSIRASFDHSWKLLSDEEQDLLCRLSIFHGGFYRAAAEKISGASLPLLASLASKSLVRRMENSRYDLHEVIRQFALVRLDEHARGDLTRDRHCSYYLELVAEQETALKSAAQQEALRKLIDEMDNLRAAYAYALKHKKYALLGNAIRSYGWFFEASGLLDEGIEHFEPLTKLREQRSTDPDLQKVLGFACMQKALLHFRKGQFSHARRLYKESIDVLRLIGDQTLLVDAYIFLGIILHLDGEYEVSYSYCKDALAFAQAGNDRWFAAYALYNLGYIDSLLGRYEEGYEKMLAGLETWRSLGDPQYITLGLNYLVTTQIRLGRFDEAHANMQESLQLCEQSNNRWGKGTAYRFWGRVYLEQGNYSTAKTLLLTSLDVHENYVIGWDIACTLSYLGDATLMAGDLGEAQEIYKKALRISSETNGLPIALEILLGLASIFMKTGEQETGRRLLAHITNNAASPQEIKDRAQMLLKKLDAPESQTGHDSPTFDQLVNEILGA